MILLCITFFPHSFLMSLILVIGFVTNLTDMAKIQLTILPNKQLKEENVSFDLRWKG